MLRCCYLLLLVVGSAQLYSKTLPPAYQSIIERNAFGLVEARTEPPEPPLLKPLAVSLTGFSKFGETKVYLIIEPNAPERKRYLSLSEGQHDGALEILNIDEEKGEVLIRNTGIEMTLSFQKDGLRPTPAIPPGHPSGTLNGVQAVPIRVVRPSR